MISPEEARKAYEKYGSIRKACKKLGVPRTTFRRALNKAFANEERTQVQREPKKPSPLVSSNKNRKITNLVLPDVHSPYHDEEALKTAISFVKDNYNITHVTLAGDLVDFWQISRFIKNPRERMPFSEEMAYNVEVLKRLQEAFPDCTWYYLKGNHEDRFDRYLMQQAPEMIGLKGCSIEEQLQLKELGIKYIDNVKLLEEEGKPFSIGELYYLHGHEIGAGGTINVARNKFLKVQKNICFGHHHQVQSYFQRSFDDILGSWSIGCLCNTSPQYMPVNAHLQGLAVVEHGDNGTFRFHNHIIIGGEVF